MYTLLKNSGLKKSIRNELPSLVVSAILAEAFYEFGSFLLECGAFMITWFCISYVLHQLPSKKSIQIKSVHDTVA